MLTEAGLERYEVSNWARPGRECRYNMAVWAQGEYEAYGNGAHGFRDGVRFRNHRRLDVYVEKVESGDSARVGEEALGGWDAEIDRLFVGLRRTVGVAPGPGTERLLDSEEGRLLVDAGVLAEENGRLVVVRPLLTDAVHRSVLAQNAPIVTGDGIA
jgi:oxygen-independent coproporphyrinogen-3 oxidase